MFFQIIVLKGPYSLCHKSHIDLFKICYFFFLWFSGHIALLLLSFSIASCTPGMVHLQFSCSGKCVPHHGNICYCSSSMTLLLVDVSEKGQRYQLCLALGKTRWYRSAGATAVTNSKDLRVLQVLWRLTQDFC